MPCTSVQNLIQEFVDGRLTEEEKKVVLEHLSECERCRKDLANTEFFSTLLKENLKLPDAPDDFVAKVLEAVGGK